MSFFRKTVCQILNAGTSEHVKHQIDDDLGFSSEKVLNLKKERLQSFRIWRNIEHVRNCVL